MSGLTMTPEERVRRAIASVRLYLRDKRETNRVLLGQFESTDPELAQALFHALQKWNMSPPRIAMSTLENHPCKSWLVEMAAVNAIRTAMLWHSREHLPSSDGGTSADDHAKAAEYSAWLDRLEQPLLRQMQDLKEAINVEQALGNMSLSSEYAWSAMGFGTYNIYGGAPQDTW